MSNESSLCPKCGAAIATEAPQGLCPKCLMAVVATPTEGAATGGARLAPPPIAEVAAAFPQLEILELIGQGGMGVVFKARQPKLDRLVALKILPQSLAADAAFADRFTREGRVLARLNHPNIVTIHDFGQANGFFYLLMEFVDGVNLRQAMQAGRFTPAQALAVVPKICDALQYAHNEGILHRDIKPENILLDAQGRVKIADFGIAKLAGDVRGASLTASGAALGTPHYMAPEQIEKPGEVDHRADIYSLGVVFYEMLTGELPLGRFAPPSEKSTADPRLDDVVFRTLAKEPAKRPQSAGEVKTQVETIAAAPGEQNQVQPRETRMNISPRSRRLIAVGALVFAAAIVVGLAMFFFRGRASDDPNRLAQEGWQFWQARRLDEAAAKFTRAVALAPENANAWNGLGWASFNSGHAEEGEKAFQKVIALEPNHPAALNGLGQIYLSQRKYDLAETYLLKAAPQAPAAWYGLARLYLIQGQFEEAERWVQSVVDSGQADDVARQMLKAAQAKRLSEGLRLMIEPRSGNAKSGGGSAATATADSMRALAVRICDGDQSALDELGAITRDLYRDIDYAREENRVLSNLTLMRAAFAELGQQAGRGNEKAFAALRHALGTEDLRALAPDALGIAAAAGHGESLDILLNYEQWGILLSSTMFALRHPAKENNERAIDFLIAVIDDPTKRPLWNGAADGLKFAAASGHFNAKAAVERYKETRQK